MTDRGPRRDTRKIFVPAPDSAPDAASGPDAAPGASVFASGPAAPPRGQPGPARPTTPVAAPPATKGQRRRLLPGHPKLRRVLLLTSLLLPVLLLLGALGSYLYARSMYNRIETIPLASVLSPGAAGTTYLIVGSDTRDLAQITKAGLDPGAFQDGGGQRSDTMLLLRFVHGQAQMLSIPRDLYVPIAETGGSSKINAAYNGGPRRLVLTIQQALGVPIQHYLEVDFVSFAKLVDSLGGITIDFPHPAYDTNSGLNVGTSGPTQLDGPQALAYVRSRHYVEVVGGQTKPDLTGDLGRVQRQQQFLKAVFAKLGASKNPFELARAGNATTGGLRIDDTLGLTDSLRLAWRLRSLNPAPVELPVDLGRNQAGSVLFLHQPTAEAALAQFR